MTLEVQRQMLALAGLLEPNLRAELQRLFAVDEHHQVVTAENADLQRRLHASTVALGELRGKHAELQGRFEELGPREIVRARRDAHMNGFGFLRVRALGGGRYASEAIDPKEVTIRAPRRL